MPHPYYPRPRDHLVSAPAATLNFILPKLKELGAGVGGEPLALKVAFQHY